MEISGIMWNMREASHAYWERIKKLYAHCPKHGISDYQILHYLIEGITHWERRLLNASSGGSLSDKTPIEICDLIKNKAHDSKHTSHNEEWFADVPCGVEELNIPYIEAQLSELKNAVMMLIKLDAIKGGTTSKTQVINKDNHPLPNKGTIPTVEFSANVAATTFLSSRIRVDKCGHAAHQR